MWGSGSGALVEAIPIAATAGMKVVTVDYRLAPEHLYPAASEDVAAVYAALLKRYRPEDIGIYGCSAGGVITAQAVSWFQTHSLPGPGAIGTFCGTGAPYGGDSVFLAGPTMATKPLIPGTVLPDILPTPYLAGVPASDAGAYPVMSDAVLARFPPTLLLAGSRDFAASVMTTTHRRLARLGVPSELYIFDGLPHAFFVWPEMPESREAYGLIAHFFDAHLGKRAPAR
ncbi:MAG: alpha/beta hydrolase [Sphingomonas sp.]